MYNNYMKSSKSDRLSMSILKLNNYIYLNN
nr:MAG TPA: hypothetical protein [Crassvirales sp.]